MSFDSFSLRSEVLDRIADFPLFALPDPGYRNQSIMADGGLIAVKVHEALHRFQVDVKPPTARRGLESRAVVGPRAALLRMLLSFSPRDYVAAPGAQVPATPMDPSKPQRIVHNGNIQFDAPSGTGFRTFGTGTLFPIPGAGGEAKFYLGAVISMLRGFGAFEGCHGMSVVNGLSEPPLNMALGIMLRVYGPHPLSPPGCHVQAPAPIAHAEAGISYLTLLAERAGTPATAAGLTAGQRIKSVMQDQALRTVDVGFETSRSAGVCSRTTAGPIVGSLSSSDVYFEPTEPGPPPYPFLTEGTVLTLRGRGGKVAGTIRADIVEGRGFPVDAPGAHGDVYQVGGIAPIVETTGQLEGMTGMVSMNSFYRLSTGACSQLFVLRMIDPKGYFKMPGKKGGRDGSQ